jgi:hypothetical protein
LIFAQILIASTNIVLAGTVFYVLSPGSWPVVRDTPVIPMLKMKNTTSV